MGASKYGASIVAVTGLVICYAMSFAPFVVVPKFVFATVVMAPGLDYLHTYMYRPFRTIRYVVEHAVHYSFVLTNKGS